MTTQSVVFWDIDGTLVAGSMERVFIRFLRQQRVISASSIARNFLALALRLPPPKWYQVKLCYLRGLTIEEIARHAKSCWQETLRSTVFNGGEESVRRFEDSGSRQVLLSGTILPLASQIGRHLGISDIIAAEPEISAGVYTGRTVAEYPHGVTKVTLAENWLERNNCTWGNTIAIANHWQDRFLLENAKTAIAAHPDDRLRKYATTKRWPIVYDLSEIAQILFDHP